MGDVVVEDDNAKNRCQELIVPGTCARSISGRPLGGPTVTAGILQYISIQFEILTNQEAPITGIHCKMPTVSTVP